jgi:hypothetical protein
MIKIERALWLPQVYARAASLVDVLRQPANEYAAMNAATKDSLRQTQIVANEVLRVLGFHGEHALIMKSDRVLGWLLRDAFVVDAQLQNFEYLVSEKLSIEEFFQVWQGTSYLWGGMTSDGIDCSGLTQRYFWDVLELRIPKNTYDQRRAGVSKSFEELIQHDLVFCTRIGGHGIHHVGIYVDGDIWHAHGERGVIRVSISEFTSQYQVLEVIQIV